MEKHQFDLEKDLCDPPLSGRGFSTILIKGVEERINKKSVSRKVIPWVSGITTAVLLLTAFLISKDNILTLISNSISSSQPQQQPGEINLVQKNKQTISDPNSTTNTGIFVENENFIEGRLNKASAIKAFDSVKRNADFKIWAPSSLENNLTYVVLDRKRQTLNLEYSDPSIQIWQTPKSNVPNTKNPLNGQPVEVNGKTWYYSPSTKEKPATVFSAELNNTMVSVSSSVLDYDAILIFVKATQCINCQ